MTTGLVSREEWGAAHGQGSELRGERVGYVLHHFASPHVDCGAGVDREVQAIQGVEKYHAVNRGWNGIGYHFVVFQSGRIFEGRGWERVGAHASGHNRTTYGICLAIDGANHSPTRAAVEAVRWLIEVGVKLGYVEEDYTLRGHRDVGSTTCPGELVYRLLAGFRADGP